MEPICSEAELQEFHPANSLVGVARHLMSLQSSQLRLNALLLDDKVPNPDPHPDAT